MPLRPVLALFGLFLAALPATAADPWHLPAWPFRAVVTIPKPSTEAGVDTGGVKVLCQGRGKPDGSDYRVLDTAGKAVPFQLMFHDASRYSLISFRATDPKQKYFVYFGNAKADRAPEQVLIDPRPGAGPPKGDWIPKYGLVLETIRRPEKDDNPRTVEDMAKLIAGSKAKDGARYQRRISDGYNPFGSSDYYISLYRGWITIPKAGKYQFCTASNEASFSFIDGKKLVHWPGRHTAERGARGEVNETLELTAGLHYVEYYHEEVTLDQMAFLGWRPSADEGPFGAIPESVYTAPHAAAVERYENAKGPLLHFEPIIADSVWPVERSEGQYTRCRFTAGRTLALPDGTNYRWEFGDGQTATGPEAEHVYLALGNYTVALTANGPGGTQTARWPLEVYEIEHITEQFKEGRPKDYAKLARGYDRTKLDAPNLKELAHLFAEADDPAEAVAAGEAFLKQHEAAKPDWVPRVRRLMADCEIRRGKEKIDAAIANYQASVTKDTPLAERLDTLARLIRLLGIERNLPEKAAAVRAQIEEAVKDAKFDEDSRRAYKRAAIAVGDVYLWQNQLDNANERYQKAETLRPFIPAQVRAARVGAFPGSLRKYIEDGNLGAALDLIENWEETFPTDKPKGQTFFWRGKVLLLRGQPLEAARFLDGSLRLAPGAASETEAYWLRAQALEQLGRPKDALRELAKLVATGATDEFAKQARAKLKAAMPPK